MGWTGDFSGGESTHIIRLDRDRCGKAIFGTALAVSNVGPGRVELEPDLPWYPYGSDLRLTAFPKPGNQFVSWGGAAAGSVNAPTLVIARTNPTVRALFLSSGTDFPLVVQPIGRDSSQGDHGVAEIPFLDR